MKYSMTTPCGECPFLNNAQMRRGFTMRRLKEFASAEFPCHQTARINDESGDYEATEQRPLRGRFDLQREARDAPSDDADM